MKIYLLTHQRELHRKTNTGFLALNSSPDSIKRVIWDRVNPCQKLMKLIKSEKTALLFPSNETKTTLDPISYDNIIILDATWQEAKKMINQSDYLKNIETISLSKSLLSKYQLRKNQPSGGLCTIESVIEVYKLAGKSKLAEKLQGDFLTFNSLR